MLLSGLQGQVRCKNPPAPFPRTPSMDARHTKTQNDSPQDGGESQTQPQRGCSTTQTHITKMRVGLAYNTTALVGGRGKNVDLRQHETRDSNHVVERSRERSHQQKTRDSIHASESFNADSEFRVPHQYDASLAGLSDADNWVPRALLSSCFIILPCTHKVFFLSFC